MTAARFDSIVNDYLIRECGLHPPTSPQHPLAAHAHTDYFASIAYPAVAEAGLRVARLGRASVTYEVALFEKGAEKVCAVGEFVHVFVDRETGRARAGGMTEEMRRGLEKIRVDKGDQPSKSTGGSSKL